MVFVFRVVRSILLLFLAFVSTIGLTACNPQDFKTQAAQVPQLIVSTTTDPKTFNYALNNSYPNIFDLTYEGLVDQNGVTAEIIPALAESWKVSEDKTHVIFTLREGLKWSDGTPLTSDDVVFTYNDVYLNEKIPTAVRDTLRIGVKQALPVAKKLSPRQVEFILPEPFVPFVRAAGAPILPAHKLRAAINTKDSAGNLKFLSTWGTDTDPNEIITNGPYTLESYATSQRVVYRRNPHYWRKDAQGNPLPYIERIVTQIIDNSDARVLRFRSGELDMLGLRPEDFSLLKHEEKRGEFTIRNGGPTSGTMFIAFNLNQALDAKGNPFVDPIKSRWFNSKQFRQAFAYALNRQRIIDNSYRGIGELQNSPISVQSPYFFSPQQGLKVYNYDPEKAKELLQSAGFKYNPAGQLFDAAGHRVQFRLLLPASSKTGQAIATQIQQDVKKIGIQLDLDPVDFNVLIEKISNRTWDMYFLSYTGGVEPNDGANYWMSTGASHDFNQGPQPGRPPIKGWAASNWEKEIDRLFIEGAKEFNEAKRKQIYAKFQEIVQDEVPIIHLVNSLALSAARDFIQGIQPSGLDNRGSLWNIYDLKLAKK